MASHRASHRTDAGLKHGDLGLKVSDLLGHRFSTGRTGVGELGCRLQVHVERVHTGKQGQGILAVLEVPCLAKDIDLPLGLHHLVQVLEVEADVGTNGLGIHGIDLVVEHLFQRFLRGEQEEGAVVGGDGLVGLSVREHDDCDGFVVGHVVPCVRGERGRRIRRSLRSSTHSPSSAPVWAWE